MIKIIQNILGNNLCPVCNKFLNTKITIFTEDFLSANYKFEQLQEISKVNNIMNIDVYANCSCKIYKKDILLSNKTKAFYEVKDTYALDNNVLITIDHLNKIVFINSTQYHNLYDVFIKLPKTSITK